MADVRSTSVIQVPLRSDISPFSKGFDKAVADTKKSVKAIEGHVDKMSFSGTIKSIGQMGIGFLTVGTIAKKSFDVITSGFRNIKDLASDALEIGATAEELSRLKAVAVSTATDFKDLTGFVGKLTEKINDSIGHTDLQAESFKKLGTSAEELSKLSVGDQLKKLNQGFNKLPNEAEKARVAIELAGTMGAKNFKLLTASVDEFEKAYNAGLVTTDDDVTEIQKLQKAMDKIGDTVERVANLFTVTLAPAITKVADVVGGFADKFASIMGVTIKKTELPAFMKPSAPATSASAKPAVDPKVVQKMENDRVAKQAEAFKAQQKAVKLAILADKQRDQIAKARPQYVPTGNNRGMKLSPKQQKMLDAHSSTMNQLNDARKTAQRLQDESLSPAQAIAQATRMKRTADDVAKLKDQYRESISTSGQDDVHRRVNEIKGLTDGQRKNLLAHGYRARQADRTSSLRDELQESTKLPAQRLAEDLDRINRMVALGAANGGLSREQGIRAAAQKTHESGLAGGYQLAGALDTSKDRLAARSYLLQQFNRQADDPVQVAKQGLALTGQSNNLLGRILNAVQGNRSPVVTY